MADYYNFKIPDWKEGVEILASQENAFEIKGFFLEIMNLIYENEGVLPDNDKLNSHRLFTNPRKYRSLKNKLLKFGLIEIRDGLISNSGCEKELSQIGKVSERQSNNRRKRAEKINKSLKNNDSDLTTVKPKEESGSTMVLPKVESRKYKEKDVSNDTNVSSLPSSGGGGEKEKLVSKKSFKENPQDIEPIPLDDNPLMVEAEKVLEKYRNICRKLFGSDTTRLDKVVLDAFEVAKWLEAGATSELILAVLETGLMSKGSQPATVGYFKQSVAQAISSAKESFDVSAYAKAGSKAFSNLSYEEQDRQSRKAAWKRAEEEAKRKLAAKELANGK